MCSGVGAEGWLRCFLIPLVVRIVKKWKSLCLGLYSPWNSPGQNTGVGVAKEDLPNPGIEPRSSALQADSLPAEPPGKPKNTGVGSLSLFHGIFLTHKLNLGLLHCRLHIEGYAMHCFCSDPLFWLPALQKWQLGVGFLFFLVFLFVQRCNFYWKYHIYYLLNKTKSLLRMNIP